MFKENLLCIPQFAHVISYVVLGKFNNINGAFHQQKKIIILQLMFKEVEWVKVYLEHHAQSHFVLNI
jgi:hypothetical protein